MHKFSSYKASHRAKLIAAVTCIILGGAPIAQAINWISPGGGTWSFGPNWSGGVAPTITDPVNFNIVPNYTYSIGVTPDAVAASIAVANGNNVTLSGNDSLVTTISGATTVASGGVLGINYGFGTLKTGSLDLGGDQSRLNWTSGKLEITSQSLQVGTAGGVFQSLTVSTGKTLKLSNPGNYLQAGITSTRPGNIIVNGGTIDVAGTTDISTFGTSSLTISSGTLKTGQLSLNGDASRLNWTSGTLELTASSASIGQSNNLLNTIATNALTIGNGKTLNVSNTSQTLTVGAGAVGNLTVNNGGTVSTASHLYIASNGSGVANGSSVTVTGSGSSLSVGGYLEVGHTGYGGVMTVADSATVSAVNVHVGFQDFATLTSSITIGSTLPASPSTLNVSGFMTLGSGDNGTGGTHTGRGTLTVNSNSTATINGLLKVWNDNSKINLTGGTLKTGSLDTAGITSRLNWTSGVLEITNSDISIGSANTDQLGATRTIGTGMTLKTIDGVVGGATTGKLTVGTGGTLSISGGNVSVRSLDRTNATAFNFTNGALQISGGTYTQPTGALVVSGAAAGNNPLLKFSAGATNSLNNVTGVVIGGTSANTEAQILIEGGSVLADTGNGISIVGTYAGTNVYSGNGYLGLNTSSTGTATITGVGSKWTNTNAHVVGYYGNGVLNVLAGGEVSDFDGFLGFNAGSSGTATVTGSGSKWTNTNELDVGFSGNGVLNLQDAGEVSDINGYVGRNSGSTGIATVTGSGSKWTNIGEIRIGSFGIGTLNIEAGGEVSNTDGHIGAISGSSGTVNVTGAGSRWLNTHVLRVGNSGVGILNVESGGIIEVIGSTIVNSAIGSKINLKSGGTLKTGSLNLSGDASRLNWTGGTLHLTGGSSINVVALTIPSTGILKGIGTVNGNISVATGGHLAPGNSPGLLNITGNLNTTGILDIEIAGTTPGTQYDQVLATGSASIGGSSLDISVINGFVPTLWQTYTILDAASLSGTFAGLPDGTMFTSGGYEWGISYNTSAGTVTLTSLPEPTTLGLLGLGAMGMLRRKRKA